MLFNILCNCVNGCPWKHMLKSIPVFFPFFVCSPYLWKWGETMFLFVNCHNVQSLLLTGNIVIIFSYYYKEYFLNLLKPISSHNFCTIDVKLHIFRLSFTNAPAIFLKKKSKKEEPSASKCSIVKTLQNSC